jgi:tRNA-modifying protein YgfZ
MSADTISVSAAPLLFNRSARLRMQFSGAKAAESLTGLVTNDVLALRGGDGLYACALTAKGRIIADVRILAFAGDDDGVQSFLVDANSAAGVGFAAMIRKYVNPRLAKYLDVTESTACLTLTGAGAVALLQTIGADAAQLAAVTSGVPFTHRTVTIGTAAVHLVRVPDLGNTETLDLHCSSSDADALRVVLTAAGAVEADDTEWHRRRVMAARPEWGTDMDETTLAQEANMDGLEAISYKKGCYTGQETVARVHFRGHVNRTIRRITLPDGDAPAPATSLMSAEGAAVGDARSTAKNEAGALIGLAMLRREVGDGAELAWTDPDGGRHPVLVNGVADAS